MEKKECPKCGTMMDKRLVYYRASSASGIILQCGFGRFCPSCEKRQPEDFCNAVLHLKKSPCQRVLLKVNIQRQDKNGSSNETKRIEGALEEVMPYLERAGDSGILDSSYKECLGYPPTADSDYIESYEERIVVIQCGGEVFYDFNNYTQPEG